MATDPFDIYSRGITTPPLAPPVFPGAIPMPKGANVSTGALVNATKSLGGSAALGALGALAPFAAPAALGTIQTIAGLKKLRDLRQQPLAKYDQTLAGQNVQMYQQRYNEGLSGAERAAMGQEFASSQAGFNRTAREASGGQLSNFLGRTSALDRVRYASQLGSAMAQERRAAMGGLASARQTLMSQKNMQTQFDLQRRMQAEQALGQAVKTGTENIVDSATYGIYDYRTAKAGGTPSGPGMMNYNPYNPYNTFG